MEDVPSQNCPPAILLQVAALSHFRQRVDDGEAL